MDQKQCRRSITAGVLIVAICVLVFASLASTVLANNSMMTPKITLVTFGVSLSATLVAGAWLFRMLVEYGNQRWWHGYAAAVKDLKASGGAEAVRIPATRNGRS